MKKVLLAAAVYIFIGIFIVVSVISVENREKQAANPQGENMPDTNEAGQAELVASLRREADKNKIVEREIRNIAEYNKCLYIINSFFEDLEYGDYEAAYSNLSEEYKVYKDIGTIEKFKEYVKDKSYENTVGDIQAYNRTITGNKTMFVCDAVLFERIIEKEIRNNDELEEYLADRPVRKETLVLTLEDNDYYKISFEGLITIKNMDHVLINKTGALKVQLVKEYIFTDRRAYEIKVTNDFETDINLADIFHSITAVNADGTIFWADLIANSMDNEIYSGQEADLMIYIDSGTVSLQSLNFKFNSAFAEKSIIIAIQ